MEYCILVVNPGSTSTKIAVFQGEKALLQKTIRHSGEELAPLEPLWTRPPSAFGAWSRRWRAST
ncbi:MAG: hypothetical protein ACLR5H_05010 [Oscillospiraceae bacterium]